MSVERRPRVTEDEIVLALLARKEEYEAYFAVQDLDLKGIDNPARTAYMSIIKMLYEIVRRTEDRDMGQDEMQSRIERILEDDYGIKIQA